MSHSNFVCYRSILSIVVLLGISHPSSALELAIGKSLQLGDTLTTAEHKLEGFCEGLSTIEVSSPRFPLAANNENHLICDGYNDGALSFEQAAFVIADDQFVQMEAKGINVAEVRKQLGETDSKYLGMDIYKKGTYWLDQSNTRLMWLHDDAKHPNLFSWRNPYLPNSEFQNSPASIEIPRLLDFERKLEQLKPIFAEQCDQTRVEHHENVWLPNKPKEQVQINCFGYLYAGFERKMEAVFGDGNLQVIWILTAKAEEQRLRKLLMEKWGEAETQTDNWEVYANGRISLRKDKPELLVLSDSMIPLYREMLHSAE